METQTTAQVLQNTLMAWFKELTAADLPQQIHCLETKLKELPHHTLSPAEWFDILELFLPLIKAIGENSQKLYKQPSNHNATERFYQFGRCQHLLLQLAIAYGIIINRTLFEENTFSIEQLQCNTLQRAIELLLQVHYHCYGAYHPMPTNVWSCLHQFYFLGEKKQLLHKQPDFKHHLSHLTIDELYKEALLLATARLNQLQPNHLKEAFTLIPGWVNAITITKNNETNNYYHIHLDLDEPPLYMSLEQRMTDPVTTRFFHCQTLLQQLKDTTVEQHLQKAWQGFHIRQQPRINIESNIPLSYGFQHGYLNLQEKKEKKGFHETWQITNSSAKGFHLENTKETKHILEPKTLITYKNPALTNFDVWSLGIIRWLKQTTAQNVEIGIETLANSGLSVQTKDPQGNVERGILLLGSLVKKQPNTILFPSNHPWKENHILDVQHPKLQLTIRLTFSCDSFMDCQQFEYALLETKSNAMGWRHITCEDIEDDGPMSFFPRI